MHDSKIFLSCIFALNLARPAVAGIDTRLENATVRTSVGRRVLAIKVRQGWRSKPRDVGANALATRPPRRHDSKII